MLTHYHSDHRKGIAKILKVCTEAKIFTSSTLASEPFYLLLSALTNGGNVPKFFNELLEIKNILENTNRKLKVLSDLSEPLISVETLKVFALSPNNETEIHFDNIYKKLAEKYIETGNRKLKWGKDRNLQSVVLIVEIADLQILYGADFEYHNKNIGWRCICDKSGFKKYKFDLLKIPHHGSKTAYNQKDWKDFLKENSILKLTPYSNSNLPRKSMISNILSISKTSFITLNPAERYDKLPKEIQESVGHLNIRKISKGYGAIEVTSNEKGKLKVVLSGNAVPLSKL